MSVRKLLSALSRILDICKRKNLFVEGSVVILLMLPGHLAFGQHPIEVQRLAAKGEYFKALSTYDSLPDRRKTADTLIAAGRSAWALGLSQRAIEEFDKALQDETLDKVLRGRVLLSRGIIEYQEGRYQIAVLYAERSNEALSEPSPLRAKVWLLWGQALSKLGSWAIAEVKLQKGLDEAADEDVPEVHYFLGVAKYSLGKNKEAKEHFERVPLENERTPLAIRNLASIALEEGQFEEAIFWLEKGKKDFRDSFLDSWVDYAAMQAAIGKNDLEKVREIRANAQKQYPPSDKWYALLDAAAEIYEWKSQTHGVNKS